MAQSLEELTVIYSEAGLMEVTQPHQVQSIMEQTAATMVEGQLEARQMEEYHSDQVRCPLSAGLECSF